MRRSTVLSLSVQIVFPALAPSATKKKCWWHWHLVGSAAVVVAVAVAAVGAGHAGAAVLESGQVVADEVAAAAAGHAQHRVRRHSAEAVIHLEAKIKKVFYFVRGRLHKRLQRQFLWNRIVKFSAQSKIFTTEQILGMTNTSKLVCFALASFLKLIFHLQNYQV